MLGCHFNGWSWWRAVLPETFLKELCELGIRLFPFVDVIDLKCAKIFTGTLLYWNLVEERWRGYITGCCRLSTSLLKLELEHDLLLDSLFIIEVEDRGSRCT
jgi:hypothetical protein